MPPVSTLPAQTPSTTPQKDLHAAESGPKSFIAAIAKGDAVLTLSDHGPNPTLFRGSELGRSHN
jgi:hypothetical protein